MDGQSVISAAAQAALCRAFTGAGFSPATQEHLLVLLAGVLRDKNKRLATCDLSPAPGPARRAFTVDEARPAFEAMGL